MKEPDLFYIAGLFDGEGSIYITCPKHARSRRHYLFAVISNTNLSILEFVRNEVGFGSITKSNSHIGWRQRYQYVVTCKQAEIFISLIEPFLKIKRRQAKLAIDYRKLG